MRHLVRGFLVVNPQKMRTIYAMRNMNKITHCFYIKKSKKTPNQD